MESYITDKKNLYTAILDFLENSVDYSNDGIKEQYFEMLSPTINHIKDGDYECIHEFLQIIKSISDNHHRDQNFIRKTKELLQYYKDEIKQNIPNDEIFHIFENNKLIILFLLENQTITITEPICSYMMNKQESNGNCYCHFFYPELEYFLGEDKMEDVRKELLNKSPNAFENYEVKRQEGENDSHICSMIRKDSVVEFISYVNRNNYSLSSQILPSIFETNSFLINQKNITFIEYSAFFGSIQIFQYLKMNGVELTPSLWLHVIHSKNAELIHILETNNICPPLFESQNKNGKNENDEEEEKEDELNNSNNQYLRCFIESIRCHHKDFSDYIENSFLSPDLGYSKQKEMILCNYLQYHNYFYFDTGFIKEHGFIYLCLYNYNELIMLLLIDKKNEIKIKIIKILKF